MNYKIFICIFFFFHNRCRRFLFYCASGYVSTSRRCVYTAICLIHAKFWKRFKKQILQFIYTFCQKRFTDVFVFVSFRTNTYTSVLWNLHRLVSRLFSRLMCTNNSSGISRVKAILNIIIATHWDAICNTINCKKKEKNN